MDTRRRTILVVDNNQTFVMYLGLLLRRLSFCVLSAPSAERALEILASEQVDAIISEGRTPSFDGLEFVRMLRSHPAFNTIPLIVIATYGAGGEHALLVTAGARGILAKPVTPAQLHSSLHCLIDFPSGRRRFPRIQLNLKVRVEMGGDDMERYLTSLSSGGAFLRHDQPIATGSDVTLHFPAPDGAVLPLRGNVLYNRQLFKTAECVEPGFAVLFRALTPDQKGFLEEFIHDQLVGDLEPFHATSLSARPYA